MKTIVNIFLTICIVVLTFGVAEAVDMGEILSAETRCGSLTSPAQTDSFTFTANAGETVIIALYGTNISYDAVIDLYDPDGILETSVISGGRTALLNDYQLLKSGLYTIIVRDKYALYVSDYCLSFLKIPGAITSPQDPNGGDIFSGETKSGIIDLADTDAYVFAGNAGETVIITLHGMNISFDAAIDLYDPDGILETSVISGGSTALLNDYQLLKSGLYTIVVRDGAKIYVSDYDVSLTKVPGALQSPLVRITLNDDDVLPGDTLTATLNIKNGPASRNVEAKIWIQFPDGNEIPLIQVPALSLSSNMNTNYTILNYTFTGSEPAGSWAIGAMVENPVTGREISIDIVPFTVSH